MTRLRKGFLAIQIIFLVFLTYLMAYQHIYAEEIEYRNMVREVENNNLLGGLYDAQFDIYACSDQHSCEHERGHAHDASGASETWLYDEWRSTDLEFHKNLDIIYNCMVDFYNNNGDPKRRNLSEDKVLMAISIDMSRYSTEEWEHDKEKPYRESYASVYAQMKLHHWDEYHYQDVEDMVSQRAKYCQAVEADIVASYD